MALSLLLLLLLSLSLFVLAITNDCYQYATVGASGWELGRERCWVVEWWVYSNCVYLEIFSFNRWPICTTTKNYKSHFWLLPSLVAFTVGTAGGTTNMVKCFEQDAPGRLVVFCPWQADNSAPFKTGGFKIFGIGQGWWTFFEGSFPKSGKFSEEFFSMWKPQVTSTKFPIVPVTSQLQLPVGAPGRWPSDPHLKTAMVL